MQIKLHSSWFILLTNSKTSYSACTIISKQYIFTAYFISYHGYGTSGTLCIVMTLSYSDRKILEKKWR